MSENKYSIKDEGLYKDHRSQFEGVPNGQSWNNWSNKITVVLDYNP